MSSNNQDDARDPAGGNRPAGENRRERDERGLGNVVPFRRLRRRPPVPPPTDGGGPPSAA